MHGEKEMIDEQATLEKYGYYSTDLTPKNGKCVVAVCDGCGAIRYPKKYSYRDLCHLCACRTDEHRRNLSKAGKGRRHTEDTKHKISKSHIGIFPTDEHRRKNSEAQKNRPSITDETRRKISKEARERIRSPHTEEARHKMSATRQGIPLEEWDGYISNGEYCELFDEVCKERVREKYNRLCFICDKNENDNGRKLDVHHVDKNKTQGCDDVEWKLVPLCRSCHGHAHSKIWQARIEYIIAMDCA